MILAVRHRFAIYKKFELDIWGVCYTDVRARAIYDVKYAAPWQRPRMFTRIVWDKRCRDIKSPYLRFFWIIHSKKKRPKKRRYNRYIYRLDILPVFRKRRVYNDRFLSIRITRLYFLNYRDSQFRKLFKRSMKLRGNLEENYYYLLEGRLLAVFYRTNYMANIFEIMDFIKDGNVFINFKSKSLLNYPVPIYKFITFNQDYIKRFTYLLKRRAQVKAILFNIPRFMFISYKFNYLYLIRYPKKRDLVFPIAIDAERLVSYH